MKLKTSVIKTFVLLMLVSTQISIVMAQISPFDYGLREAVSDTDRYWALYHAHAEALARNLTVSYEGIDTLEIALPTDFKSIPLGPYTDFGGLVLYVTNKPMIFLSPGVPVFSLPPAGLMIVWPPP